MARAAAPMLRGLRAATRTTRKRSNSARTDKNIDFTTRTGKAFFRMAIEQIAFSFLWSMSSIKRDVKKKVPPRPESRFVSRDPAHCSFGSLGEVGRFVHTHRFSADRGGYSSLRERQASVVECVNHGSIRGSWPMTISGYPRGHNV